MSREDKIDLLQQLERQLTEGLAAGRNLSFARVRAASKEGPFMAARAKQAGLVDDVAFDDEIDEQLRKLLGRSTRLTTDDRRPPAPSHFAPQPSVADQAARNGAPTTGLARVLPRHRRALAFKGEGADQRAFNFGMWALGRALYDPDSPICVAASLQLAAAAETFRTFECMVYQNPLRDAFTQPIVGEGSQLTDGKLAVPQGPGLGIEIDRDALARFRIA